MGWLGRGWGERLGGTFRLGALVDREGTTWKNKRDLTGLEGSVSSFGGVIFRRVAPVLASTNADLSLSCLQRSLYCTVLRIRRRRKNKGTKPRQASIPRRPTAQGLGFRCAASGPAEASRRPLLPLSSVRCTVAEGNLIQASTSVTPRLSPRRLPSCGCPRRRPPITPILGVLGSWWRPPPRARYRHPQAVIRTPPTRDMRLLTQADEATCEPQPDSIQSLATLSARCPAADAPALVAQTPVTPDRPTDGPQSLRESAR